MKSYTDLEQSKKLAGILPLESADMTCIGTEFVPYPYCESKFKGEDNVYPAWSLAALLDVLPDYTLQTNIDGTVFVVCESKKPMISDAYNNPVDACVIMIEKLHKMNLL